jgi:small-conductance mechanosensitive channel
MKQMPLADLLADMADDIRVPGLLWQIGALVAALALGWAISGFLRRRYADQASATGVMQFGVESIGRLAGPVTIVCVLALSRLVLGKWFHVNLLKVALPIFMSLAVIRLAFFLLRKVFARQGRANGAVLAFEKLFQLMAWVAAILYIVGFWPDIFAFLDNTVLPLGKYKVSIAAVLQAVVSVAVLLMLALWAGAALEERLMNVPGVHSNLRAVMARMGRAILIVVALLASLSLCGIDLTVLSVFGGALGVGLGLGLQKIASNYLSGFIILLDRSLTIGDMVTVDKYSGRVTHINTRYTVLQGFDGVEAIVPNELFVSGVVLNSSLSSRMLALSTQVSVAYDTDLDALFPLLTEAAASVPRVSTLKKPGASLKSFGADGLDISVGFWIEDPENGGGGVVAGVNHAIWRTLKAHHIAVPSPQREVRIIGSTNFSPPADTSSPTVLHGHQKNVRNRDDSEQGDGERVEIQRTIMSKTDIHG